MERFIEELNLVEDHIIGKNKDGEARTRFFEMAKSRVILLSEKEYKERLINFFKDDSKYPIAFLFVDNIDKKYSKEESQKERSISSFRIYVNKDIFDITGDENYGDLIPYIIEHEIYEAWLYVKNGYRSSEGLVHGLVRRRVFSLAEKDRKAERLLEFLCKIRPQNREELNNIYKKIKSRGKEAKKDSI